MSSPTVRLSEIRRRTQEPARPPLHSTEHQDFLGHQAPERDRGRGINNAENSVSQDTYPAQHYAVVDLQRSCNQAESGYLPVIDGDTSPSGRGQQHVQTDGSSARQHVQTDGSPARARSDTDITRLEPATELRRTFKDRSATFDSIDTLEDSKSMFIFFDKVESTSDLELYNTPSSTHNLSLQSLN